MTRAIGAFAAYHEELGGRLRRHDYRLSGGRWGPERVMVGASWRPFARQAARVVSHPEAVAEARAHPAFRHYHFAGLEVVVDDEEHLQPLRQALDAFHGARVMPTYGRLLDEALATAGLRHVRRQGLDDGYDPRGHVILDGSGLVARIVSEARLAARQEGLTPYQYDGLKMLPVDEAAKKRLRGPAALLNHALGEPVILERAEAPGSSVQEPGSREGLFGAGRRVSI